MPERAGRPFLIMAVAFFTLLLGSNLPTPLCAVYRDRFGFSSVVLTLVFATYMLVLPTLLLCGQLSDRVGRKRVITAGLLTAAVGLGLGLFAAATATACARCPPQRPSYMDRSGQLGAAALCAGIASGAASGR